MGLDEQDSLFEGGPVGAWSTGLGTAFALSRDRLIFRADGTGLLRLTTVARGEETIAFSWRMAERGVLEILRDEDGAEEGPEMVPIELRRIETDAGAVDALFERDRDGFWLLDGPLARAPDQD